MPPLVRARAFSVCPFGVRDVGVFERCLRPHVALVLSIYQGYSDSGKIHPCPDFSMLRRGEIVTDRQPQAPLEGASNWFGFNTH